MAINPTTTPEFSGRLTAPDSNYPYSSSKNDSTGTAGDGTPIIKKVIDDIWGFQQKLLSDSGIVPSGTADNAITSQYYNALLILLGCGLWGSTINYQQNSIVRMPNGFFYRSKISNNLNNEPVSNSDSAEWELFPTLLNSSQLGSSIVTTSSIIDSAITEDKLAPSAVTNSRIASSAITASKLANPAVTNSKIASSAVTTDKIANGAISIDKMASNSVGTIQLANLSITTDKIADGAISIDKMASNSVGTNQIASSAITASKLASPAVTNSKIASSAVTQSKLNTSQGEVSAPSIGPRANLVLPGGEFGFYPRFRTTGSSAIWEVNLYFPGVPTTIPSHTTLITVEDPGGGVAGATFYAQQRYINASPPYKIGDLDYEHFIFLRISKSGEVLSIYNADVPPWVYNGPTNVSADEYGDGGEQYKYISETPEDLINQIDKVKGDPIEELKLKAEIERCSAKKRIQLTPEMKNADMGYIPHPFLGEIPEDDTIVLVSPCHSGCFNDILQLNKSSQFSINEHIHDGYLRIDNSLCDSACVPNGVKMHKIKWKNTK
jgi:hypothetical protein